MSEKFVLNSRTPVETNVRFERFGSTYRQITGIIVLFFLIFGTRLDSFAAEKTTAQVVFFSAPVAVQAEVYSSPSQQAYATGMVSEGEYVEIFFRLPQGYCAIKPPKGSFSWVNGKFLRVLSETDGQIELQSGKKAPARIGGASPEVSSVVQVGLQNKQRVKIIGKQQLADGSIWYKISPPPGEFRWIKTSDLASDPVLEQIPEKLTFQSEYLKNRQNSQSQNDVSELEVPAPTNGDYSETSEESAREIKREIAKLNADTFQALQRNPRSQEELNRLAERAEELFDGAPSDDDRFFIQSIYEIIKKTQTSESQNVVKNPFVQNSGYNGDGASQTPADPELAGAKYIGDVPVASDSFGQFNSFGQFDAGYFDQANQFGNAQVFGDQFGFAPISGVPFVDSSSSSAQTTWNSPDAFAYNAAPNVNKTRSSSSQVGSKSEPRRMGFAFSGGNSPFRSKKREARIVDGNSKSSLQTSSSLSKLPTLFPASSQEIVPPSSYNDAYGIGLSQVRQNSRLLAEAQKKRNEELAFAQAQKKLQAGPEQTVAQAAPKSVPDSNQQLAKSEPSKSNVISVAGSTPQKESSNANKIRQTSAFTPVASPTNQGYDAVGTLTILSDASEGSPRYALSSPSYAGGLVYLVPAEGVSFAPYVGRNVGVKGSIGAVVVGARSQKLVVVGSIFPL